MPALSLRLRLALLWGAVSLAVLLGLEALTLAVLGAQLRGAVDRDLALAATQYQERLAAGTGTGEQDRWAAAIPGSDPAGSAPAAIYVVRRQDGSTVTNTRDSGLRAAIVGARPRAGQAVTVRDPVHGDLRVAAIAIDESGRQVGELRVALSLTGAETTVGDLLKSLLVADGALVVLGGLLAYLAAGRGLAPVRQMTAAAAEI